MRYLIFALRAAIGILLIVAGFLKAHDGLAITGESIAGYQILPSFAVMPLAVFLPYFEIGVGAYLVLGLFTRVVASVVAAQMLIFTIAVASVVVRHIHISCGCFGAGDTTIASWYDVARDVLLTGLCVFVAFQSPGAFALDTQLSKASVNTKEKESP
jgi:putative oxidoreductase